MLWKKVYSLLFKKTSPRLRKRGILALSLQFLNSLLELFGLAAIIPVITILVNEQEARESWFFNWFASTIGMDDFKTIVLILCVTILLTFMLKNILSLLFQRFQVKYSFEVYKHFSTSLFRHYFEQGLLYVKNADSNKLTTDIMTNAIWFSSFVLLSILQLGNEVILLSLIVIAIFLYNPVTLVLLVIALVPAVAIFYRLIRKRLQAYAEEVNDLQIKSKQSLYESFHGYADVKLSGSDDFFREKFGKLQSQQVKVQTKSFFLRLVSPKVLETAVIGGLTMIIVYGFYYMDDPEGVSALLAVYALAAFRSIPSINKVMQALMGIRSYRYTIDLMSQIKDFGAGKVENVKQDEKITFEESLEFRDMTFSFPNTEETVIKDFSYKIEKGETIGIIGVSGSGKSTLINLFLRLLVEQEGGLYVDGLKLTGKNEAAFRKLVGYVPQDVYLVNGSIKENIAFGYRDEDIDEKKLKIALQRASLSEFVNSLPEGWDTPVGEQGKLVSGGQRQRIGIARALYSGAKILVFDEATSALDVETERAVTQSVYELSGTGLTMLIIAHRVTTLRDCDRIIELSKGKIKFEKTYEEVISQAIE